MAAPEKDAPQSPAGASEAKARPCPICSKPATHAYRPFCSRRCADVDLGRWLGGSYAIAGGPSDEEDISDTPGEISPAKRGNLKT